MKRLIAILMSLLLSVMFGSIQGDVNFDRKVNVLDMTIVSRIIQNRYEPTAHQLRVADMDRDGVLTAADLECIADIIMHR